MQNKRLNINPFAVAYKIAREGIKVPNKFNPGTLISDVFTVERANLLVKMYRDFLVSEAKTEILKEFKK